LPIEPPRPPKNSRQSYARRQHQFAPAVNIPAKPGIFRKASSATVADDDAVPPSISFEGRLPDPPIVTCNEPLPLRVLINKLNESPATLYLQLIELVLISDTTTQAHQLRRSDIANFILVSLSNLHVPLLPLENSKGSKEMEIDPALWSHASLPNTVVPAFDTCNLSCKHWLDIKIGLSWGSGSRMNVSSLAVILNLLGDFHILPSITPSSVLRRPHSLPSERGLSSKQGSCKNISRSRFFISPVTDDPLARAYGPNHSHACPSLHRHYAPSSAVECYGQPSDHFALQATTPSTSTISVSAATSAIRPGTIRHP